MSTILGAQANHEAACREVPEDDVWDELEDHLDVDDIENLEAGDRTWDVDVDDVPNTGRLPVDEDVPDDDQEDDGEPMFEDPFFDLELPGSGDDVDELEGGIDVSGVVGDDEEPDMAGETAPEGADLDAGIVASSALSVIDARLEMEGVDPPPEVERQAVIEAARPVIRRYLTGGRMSPEVALLATAGLVYGPRFLEARARRAQQPESTPGSEEIPDEWNPRPQAHALGPEPGEEYVPGEAPIDDPETRGAILEALS